MRILLVSQMVPFIPCRDGFRIIPANLIALLSERHEIHLIALSDASETPEQLRWAEAHCRSVTIIPDRGQLSLTRRWPRRATRLETLVSQKLEELRPHVLHLEGASLAPIARLAPAGTFKLLSAHDSLQLRFLDFARYDARPWFRLRARILAFYARGFERRWYRGLDRILVTSELDRQAIGEQVPEVPVGVVPNGVDLDFFRFEPDPEPGLLVFSGNMSWPPNEDAARHFVRDILPRIRARRPEVRFAIVGADPPPRVRALERSSGVTVTGTVADMRSWLRKAEVYVCPLRFGAGVKNKILEAMALGSPVVGTRRSFTGISIVEGSQAVIADEAGEFASAVLNLLEDADARRRLSLAGRTLVANEYTWSSVCRRFESHYPALADDARPDRALDAKAWAANRGSAANTEEGSLGKG